MGERYMEESINEFEKIMDQYIQEENFIEAEKIGAKFPNAPKIQSKIISIYIKLEEYEKAKEIGLKFPEEEKIQSQMIKIYMKEGNYVEAIKLGAEFPENPSAAIPCPHHGRPAWRTGGPARCHSPRTWRTAWSGTDATVLLPHRFPGACCRRRSRTRRFRPDCATTTCRFPICSQTPPCWNGRRVLSRRARASRCSSFRNRYSG